MPHNLDLTTNKCIRFCKQRERFSKCIYWWNLRWMHIFNNDMKLFQKSLKFSNTMTWTKFTSDKCDLNNRALKTFLIQVFSFLFWTELNWRYTHACELLFFHLKMEPHGKTWNYFRWIVTVKLKIWLKWNSRSFNNKKTFFFSTIVVWLIARMHLIKEKKHNRNRKRTKSLWTVYLVAYTSFGACIIEYEYKA